LWLCDACGNKGNLIQLEQKLSSCTFESALANISAIIGRDLMPKWPFPFAPPEGLAPWSTRYLAEEILKMEKRLHAKAVDLYDYRGKAPAHDGMPARAQVPMPKIRLKTEKNGKTQKTFRWRVLTQKGGWRIPAREHAIPDLYLQHEWHGRGGTKLHILNGEKAVNHARERWGLMATCLPDGEKAGKPALQQYIDTLAQTPCLYIVVDNDDVGRRHAGGLGARLLQAGAAEVHLVRLVGLPPKGDLYDFIEAGGTLDEYLNIARTTPVLDATTAASAGNEENPSPAVNESRDGVASGFRLEKDGLYFAQVDSDPVYVSGPLEILACSSTNNGENWSRLVRWHDRQGREQNMVIPMELVVGDPAAYRRMLASRGLLIATGPKGQNLLSRYIQFTIPKKHVQLVNHIGWHERTYVLPGGAICAGGTDEVLYDDHGVEHHYRTAGTLQDWQQNISAKCRGNTRLLFALGAAFAAPLLAPLGIESGGFHFVGPSSLGKTTTLMVAGSAIGGGNRNQKGFLETWRGTSNGFESVAELHHDNLLLLDEIGQVEPKEADHIVYMLANGSGNRRMQRNITARRSLNWRLMFLSSGEMKLAEHAATAGKRVTAGVDVRLLNIPADAGKGMGLFENLHGAASARQFADQLMKDSTLYYGHAQRAFVQYLVGDYHNLVAEARDTMNDFIADTLPKDASPEVGRALQRAALDVAAGELATRLGITGWHAGEASHAGRQCFRAWLSERGGAGSFDMEAAVQQVRVFIELNGSSRFQSITPRFDRNRDEILERVVNRAGFWRETNDDREYLIFPDIFRAEVCSGYNHRMVAAELAKRGYLEHGNEKDHPHMKQERVPGFANPVRFYIVLGTILGVKPPADDGPGNSAPLDNERAATPSD
jgi:putative DNA primase/helicase